MNVLGPVLAFLMTVLGLLSAPAAVEPEPILVPVTYADVMPPAELAPGPFLHAVFTESEAQVMARVRWCESRVQADAQNPSSSAAGWFQVIDSTWETARQGWPGTPGLLEIGLDIKPFEEGRYDPFQNTLVSWWLVRYGGGLSHWSETEGCWR